jgi:hypothetical protein
VLGDGVEVGAKLGPKLEGGEPPEKLEKRYISSQFY